MKLYLVTVEILPGSTTKDYIVAENFSDVEVTITTRHEKGKIKQIEFVSDQVIVLQKGATRK